MKASLPPNEQFLKAYNRFYNALKQRYEQKLEKAAHKGYASKHFKYVLFAQNKMLPRYSIFYYHFVSSYTHYRNLGESDPVEQTLAYVPTIRQFAADELERTLIYQKSLYDQLYELHWLYLEATQDGSISILQLIDTERRVLRFSEGKLILLLALFQVTQDLLSEYTDEEPNTQEPDSAIAVFTDQPTDKKLTRSQQVLIAYYVSQLLGIKQKKNVSKCADALHSFLGLPYTQITHSELYKKLLNPLTFSSVQATLKNLQIVRDFFEQLGAQSVVDFIDTDMEKLKKKLE